jgi:hypothetical protein
MKKVFVFFILLITLSSVVFAQFYTETPVCEFEVDFTYIGLGIIKYYGFRPSKEEIVNLDLKRYFEYQLDSFEILIPDSLYIIENNTSLNINVRNAMRSNNITFCKTRYINENGGITYIFNVSFDNYKIFHTIAMDSKIYTRFAYNKTIEKEHSTMPVTVVEAELYADRQYRPIPQRHFDQN